MATAGWRWLWHWPLVWQCRAHRVVCSMHVGNQEQGLAVPSMRVPPWPPAGLALNDVTGALLHLGVEESVSFEGGKLKRVPPSLHNRREENLKEYRIVDGCL